MVEKHYCDVCHSETKNSENLRILSGIEGSTKFDVCNVCLVKRTISEILYGLGGINRLYDLSEITFTSIPTAKTVSIIKSSDEKSPIVTELR